MASLVSFFNAAKRDVVNPVAHAVGNVAHAGGNIVNALSAHSLSNVANSNYNPVNLVENYAVKPGLELGSGIGTGLYNHAVAPVFNLPKENLQKSFANSSNPNLRANAAYVSNLGFGQQAANALQLASNALPGGGKIVDALGSKVAANVADKVGSQIAGQIAKKGVQYGANTAIGAGTGYGLTTGSSLIQGASLKQANQAGLHNAKLGAELGLAGTIAPDVIPHAINGAKTTAAIAKNYGLKPPTSLNQAEIASSAKILGGTGSHLDVTSQDAKNFHTAQVKLGVEPGSPAGTQAVSKALDAHVAFDTAVNQRQQALQSAIQSIKQPSTLGSSGHVLLRDGAEPSDGFKYKAENGAGTSYFNDLNKSNSFQDVNGVNHPFQSNAKIAVGNFDNTGETKVFNVNNIGSQKYFNDQLTKYGGRGKVLNVAVDESPALNKKNQLPTTTHASASAKLPAPTVASKQLEGKVQPAKLTSGVQSDALPKNTSSMVPVNKDSLKYTSYKNGDVVHVGDKQYTTLGTFRVSGQNYARVIDNATGKRARDINTATITEGYRTPDNAAMAKVTPYAITSARKGQTPIERQAELDAQAKPVTKNPNAIVPSAKDLDTKPVKAIQNPDLDRSIINTLKTGTQDEAIQQHMDATGQNLQQSSKAVSRIAHDANIVTDADNSKNPLLGTKTLPEVQLGDKDQAHLNADTVKQDERSVGGKALQSLGKLSNNDTDLLKKIETSPVSEVAKNAENPQAFTQAAKDIRTYYDTRHAYDHYLGIDTGYRANYLRQLFEKPEEAGNNQIKVTNGTKNPGYTHARTKETLNTDVKTALTKDINGSSINHAKLAYENGLNQAFPGKIAAGQMVRDADGTFQQLRSQYGGDLSASKSVASQINRRAVVDKAEQGKFSKGYDNVNGALKQTELSLGGFHSLNENLNFAGQQLASGAFLKDPTALGRVLKATVSKKAFSTYDKAFDDSGVSRRANLSGLTTNSHDILADADSSVIKGKVAKATGHDAIFARQIPMLKKITFEQRTRGLDENNPADLLKMRQTAKAINHEFGGENRNIEGSLTPRTVNVLKKGLLATDFTEGKIRTLTNALTKKGPEGDIARQVVIGKTLVATGITAAGAAAFGDDKGKSLGQIAKQTAGEVLDPSFTAGHYTVGLPGTQISEFGRPLEPLFQSKTSSGQKATTSSRLSGIEKYGTNRLSPILSDANQLINNKTATGARIYGNDYKSNGGKPITPGQTAQRVAGLFSPIPITQVGNTATHGQGVAAAIANTAGLRVSNQDNYAFKPKGVTDTGNAANSQPKSVGDAVAQLKAQQTSARQKLTASLSPDDLAISKLSSSNQQQLVKSGVITQAKLDGLNNYIAQQKDALGLTDPSTRKGQPINTQTGKAITASDYKSKPTLEYKLNQALLKKQSSAYNRSLTKSSGRGRSAKFKTVALPHAKTTSLKSPKLKVAKIQKATRLKVGKANYSTRAITPRVRNKSGVA